MTKKAVTIVYRGYITEEYFTHRVGHEPRDDDMDRVNCGCSGELGHRFCGWNWEKDMPVFMVGREGEE
jgi:hypothetical protein